METNINEVRKQIGTIFDGVFTDLCNILHKHFIKEIDFRKYASDYEPPIVCSELVDKIELSYTNYMYFHLKNGEVVMDTDISVEDLLNVLDAVDYLDTENKLVNFD